jgi:preprotein translocase subunit YajC
VREALGVMLMTRHNVHMMMEFMREIRAALDAGTFSALREQWIRDRGEQGAIKCLMKVGTVSDGYGPVPGGAGQSGNPTMMAPMYMVIFMLIFYFMLIRPQQRKEKERKLLIENLKSGEKVMFSGGILGTIANVKEHTFVIKIAENVKVEVAKGAVVKVLEKGDKVEVEDKR